MSEGVEVICQEGLQRSRKCAKRLGHGIMEERRPSIKVGGDKGCWADEGKYIQVLQDEHLDHKRASGKVRIRPTTL